MKLYEAGERGSHLTPEEKTECDLVDLWLCSTEAGDFLDGRLRTSNCLNELSEFLAQEIVPLIDPCAEKREKKKEHIERNIDEPEGLSHVQSWSEASPSPTKLTQWSGKNTMTKNLVSDRWLLRGCAADDIYPRIKEGTITLETSHSSPLIENTAETTIYQDTGSLKSPSKASWKSWEGILPSAAPASSNIPDVFSDITGTFIELNAFRNAVSSISGLSTYTTAPLYDCSRRPDGQVTVESFTAFWNAHLRDLDHPSKRLFRLLLLQRGDPQSRDYLIWKDFESMIEDVLHRHKGLRFLRDSPNFHDKYVETVIGRIFFRVNCRGNNNMTYKELEKSNIVDTLARLDQVEDINEIKDYFSYEHFYVIYHKFWELGPDREFVIGKDELRRFGDSALTEFVIDRILSGVPRKLHSATEKTMSFRDFIPFLIAVEDKKQKPSIYYWFRVLDVDGVGILSTYWLEIFFQEQKERIQQVLKETIEFSGCLRLLNDMVNPEWYGHFRIRDLVRSKMAWLFFNIMIDVQKFALYEQRDPYQISERRKTSELSDWDRFVGSEYKRYMEKE